MAGLKLKIGDQSRRGNQRKIAAMGAIADTKNNFSRYASGDIAPTAGFVTKSAQFAGTGANVVFTQPMFFSPLHTPQNWQIASKRREIYQWARFYYENEPKVAAGVDFYANFPMNGFKLECKDSKILEFYEETVERLELDEWLNFISHEYFLLGDVFPFLEVSCPVCGGAGFDPETHEPCNHPGGSFRSLRVMNPDYIEVQHNVLAGQSLIAMLPDEELKMIIQRKQPRQIYDSLPDWLIQAVASGQPIQLSPRSCSHIKHNGSGYGTYGTSMLRRLFTVLAYKTKIMTANWIVAERLILPIRVVKVGDKDRPAQAEDIQDTVNQLAAVANDPNLTIVTHHAFEYDWYGAEGKIVNINNELELIGKEILDGLMLNQSLLNGEMAGYNSAQVGVETMIRRLEHWRSRLSKWVEKHIFLPIAMMQGFVDEDRTKRLGRQSYTYPKIKWNDMNLRDNSNKVQILIQLYDKGGCSMQTICEELGLDYDAETEKLRQEQLVASAMGQVGGAQQQGGMGDPMAGGMGDMGGAPPPDGGMGDPMAGGDPAAGGAMPPGMMPPGGMDAAAAAPPPKISKKGKGGKSQEEEVQPANKILKLTKLESTMYNYLTSLNAPYRLFGQYEINMPGQPQPFVLDFAYPELGIGIETDGAIWHERSDLKQRDSARDQKLANVGWRVLRFNEQAVYEHPDAVKDLVRKHLTDAMRAEKKAEKDENGFVKSASDSGSRIEDVEVEDIDPDIGYVVRIGTVDDLQS